MSNVNIGMGSLIECPHCEGTGDCQKAIIQGVLSFPKSYYCDKCGTGTVVRSANTAIEDGMFPKRPTCEVCGGTGKVRV